MHRVGHLHGRRPPGPGTGRLTILHTQALNSACGRGHVSAGSSGLPGPGGLTLTLGRFLRLASPVAWPGSPAVWGLLMDPVGLWGPPTWKPGPLAPWRTLLAGETYMPPDRPTHLRRAPTPKSRSRTDRPTNALNSALRGASLGTGTSGLPFSQDPTLTLGGVFGTRPTEAWHPIPPRQGSLRTMAGLSLPAGSQRYPRVQSTTLAGLETSMLPGGRARSLGPWGPQTQGARSLLNPALNSGLGGGMSVLPDPTCLVPKP